MNAGSLQRSVINDRLSRTHVGFSIEPSSIDTPGAEAVTVRRIDAESFDRAIPATGPARGNRRHLKRLRRHLADGVAPGYLVCGPGNVPLLACLRIPGGPKTRTMVRQRVGNFMPQVGEREHLLASLWIAPGSSPGDLSAAFAALVHVDPPGHLSRTVVFLPRPVCSTTLSALSAAGAECYIYCIRQRSLPAFWRNRHDWIGPARAASAKSQIQLPLQAEES